jgi:hypothetical protein
LVILIVEPNLNRKVWAGAGRIRAQGDCSARRAKLEGVAIASAFDYTFGADS